MGGVAIGLGIGAFAGSGSAISMGGVTIGLGIGAFAGSGSAISIGGVTIASRPHAFPAACPAILRRLLPIGCGFSARERCTAEGLCRHRGTRLSLQARGSEVPPGRRPVTFRGGLVPLGGGAVAFRRGSVSLVSDAVALVCDVVPLVGSVVSPPAVLVALVAEVVSSFAVLVPLVGSPVALVADPVAIVAVLIALLAGLVPRFQNRTSPLGFQRESSATLLVGDHHCRGSLVCVIGNPYRQLEGAVSRTREEGCLEVDLALLTTPTKGSGRCLRP